jgi:hypothetical protein
MRRDERYVQRKLIQSPDLTEAQRCIARKGRACLYRYWHLNDCRWRMQWFRGGIAEGKIVQAIPHFAHAVRSYLRSLYVPPLRD